MLDHERAMGGWSWYAKCTLTAVYFAPWGSTAMATERATIRQPLRIVTGRPAETPVLDLAEATRTYALLLAQSRQLQETLDDLRERILRAMERTGVDELDVDGHRAIRQVRRFAPRLDEARAEALLRAAGRLEEAQRTVFDLAKARQVLEELCAQGEIREDDLPYGEPRAVEALIIRPIEAAHESTAAIEETKQSATRNVAASRKRAHH